MNVPQEEWIAIQVPKSIAPAVYALIAERMAPTTTTAAESVPSTTTDAAINSATTWSTAEVHRLIDESPPAMKAILELLAKNPGTWMRSDQLAEALKTRVAHFGGKNKPNANWQTVAGTLGAYGHRVKARYRKEAWFHPAKSDNEGYYVHLMPAEYADLVLERLNSS